MLIMIKNNFLKTIVTPSLTEVRQNIFFFLFSPTFIAPMGFHAYMGSTTKKSLRVLCECMINGTGSLYLLLLNYERPRKNVTRRSLSKRQDQKLASCKQHWW